MLVGRHPLGGELAAEPAVLGHEQGAPADARGREGRGHAAEAAAGDQEVVAPGRHCFTAPAVRPEIR